MDAESARKLEDRIRDHLLAEGKLGELQADIDALGGFSDYTGVGRVPEK